MTFLPMHGVLHLVAVLVQSLRDQLGTLQHHGDRLLRRIIPSLVRPGRRNEDLPPENLLIKWRSRGWLRIQCVSTMCLLFTITSRRVLWAAGRLEVKLAV